jgi:cytochrome P450
MTVTFRGLDTIFYQVTEKHKTKKHDND